jgi:predicted transcriptional regulator
MRRPRVEWMTRADDAILEFLLNDPNEGLIATPAFIEMNIEFGVSTCRTRIRKLYDAGLVEYNDEDRGSYKITPLGEKYLNGEIDADELEEPE